MSVALLLLLGLLLPLANSQSFPHVSFYGQTLANHSYVDLSLVGDDYYSGSDGVQCHSDLNTCCSHPQGPHRGDWHLPNGIRLPIPGGGDIFEARGPQRVALHRRNNALPPTGIYRCDIPTNAVHSYTDRSVRDTVYVGLYNSAGGDVTISGDVTYDPETQALNCISTGGPATNVSWTRDSTTVITEGTVTVLNDPVTAEYNHTQLNVTTAGVYTCTVVNNKPSSASASIIIAGGPPLTDVTAVQNGPTSIRVTWTPPSPLGDTTGYTIYYTGGDGSSGNVIVDDGNTNSLTLAILISGETYTISVATNTASVGLLGVVAALPVNLVPFSSPTLNSSPRVTLTTITITGSVLSGSMVTGFVVHWQRDTSVGCSNVDKRNITVPGRFSSYVITGLEPGNRYSISVREYNGAGSGPVSNTVIALTDESAPSGSPSSFRRAAITPNNITVQWGEIPCLSRNGVITGYIVRAFRNGIVERTVSVGGSTSRATMSGLIPSTTYGVQVAGVNSAGTGPFTSSISIRTEETVVGLEAAAYTVLESEGMVQICVNAVGTNSPCPSTLPFQVSLHISRSTGESVFEVEFASCERRRCVNESIADDAVNEPEEMFSISLNKVSSFVTLSATTGNVVIVDDDDKPVGVTFLLVNATGVRISWSGSVHLHTTILYTVYCFTTAIRQNERVFPPGVTSADFVIEDDIVLSCTYVHNFTLYYIIANERDDVVPSQGNPPSTLATYAIDKTHFQIQFGPYYYCLDWEFKKSAESIERQLQFYLAEVIRNNCSECYDFTQNFFRRGLFLCHSSPTKTTYRTTLINPFPTKNSSQLVGIIQNWVSSSPSLVLDGLLVRVSPTCPTSISRIDETECDSGVMTDPGLGERITQTLNVCALRNLGDLVCSLGEC